MPTADGRFKGLSVPADAWERIFGPTHPSTVNAMELVQHRGTPRARTTVSGPPTSPIRAAYEEHLDVIGPDTHSPFLRDFRR